MKKRSMRQELIRSIIRTQRIKTQKDLVDALNADGHKCTQATISRNISELGLRKLPEGVYVLPEDLHLQRMMHDLVLDLNYVNNMVIIKAQSGTAPGVAAALDDADLEGILGSVSGDDTIMVIAASNALAEKLHFKLETFRGVTE